MSESGMTKMLTMFREIPTALADLADRWIMSVHQGTDLGEGLEETDIDFEPRWVCTWHKGNPAWPCDDYMQAAERLAERHPEETP